MAEPKKTTSKNSKPSVANTKTAPKLAKPLVDVSPPGATAPSPNSKSVIISHHTTLQDPMVTPTAPELSTTQTAPTDTTTKTGATESVTPSVSHSSHAVLQPLPTSAAAIRAAMAQPKVSKKPDTADAAVEPLTMPDLPAVEAIASAKAAPESEAEPITEAAAPLPVSAAAPATPAPKKASPLIADVAPASASANSDAKLGVKTEAEIAADEDAADRREAELLAMVEDRRFYLPIDTVAHQRTRQFVLIGGILSIVLMVVWVDIALDAGLIHLGGIKALTHFFS